ncbi:MAG: ATP-binding protein [Chitinophagales bacterium]
MVLLYFVFGVLYIYLSDKILQQLGPELEERIQTYKGWIFIAITTALLFIVLNVLNNKLLHSNSQLAWKDKLIQQREEEKKDLERLSRELQEVNSDLQTFNYSISHDLKSPIRAFKGYTDILFAKYSYRMDEEDKEIFAALKKLVKRIDALISDLLVFSKAERSMHSETVEMTVLFEEAIKESKKQYGEKEIKITIAPLIDCYADRILIYQVVFNLVANAVKYSAKVEKPEISIGCYEEAGKAVYFVKDNGCGFDTKFANKLFQPFERLHLARDYDGTGLGLAIVEKIVSKHGGAVWADSKLEEGSTFYFSLPLNSNT